MLFSWSVSVFMPAPCCFDCYGLKDSLVLGSMTPPTLLFFLKITFAIQGLLWFHGNFWNICSNSVKYVIRILKEIVLSLQILGGSMGILMMLILSLHEHDLCLYLYLLSLQYLYNCWGTGLLHPWLGLLLHILFFFKQLWVGLLS